MKPSLCLWFITPFPFVPSLPPLIPDEFLAPNSFLELTQSLQYHVTFLHLILYYMKPYHPFQDTHEDNSPFHRLLYSPIQITIWSSPKIVSLKCKFTFIESCTLDTFSAGKSIKSLWEHKFPFGTVPKSPITRTWQPLMKKTWETLMRKS